MTMAALRAGGFPLLLSLLLLARPASAHISHTTLSKDDRTYVAWGARRVRGGGGAPLVLKA